MTISELISALETAREEYGNLPVYIPDDWYGLMDPKPHLDKEVKDFALPGEELQYIRLGQN